MTHTPASAKALSAQVQTAQDAARLAAAQEKAVNAARAEARLTRIPMVRMALMVKVPDTRTTAMGVVSVIERKDDIVIIVEEFNGIARELPLTLLEAYALIENLRKITARIRHRKPHQP